MSDHGAHRFVGFSRGYVVALTAWAALATACEKRAPAAGSVNKPTIAIIRAADWVGSEWSEDAIKVGLQEEDFERGRDYEFKLSSAQGDLATLPSLIDAALDAKATVIVTLKDGTLQAE